MDIITDTITNAIDTVTNFITPEGTGPTTPTGPPPPWPTGPTTPTGPPPPLVIPPLAEEPIMIKKIIKPNPKPKFNKPKYIGIYSTALITRTIPVNIINVGNNIKQTLEKVIALQIEGKCVVDGFVKPNSTKILTYSSGLVNGPDIIFEVTFECLVCSPVEGMHIKCVAKNITKAGIRAETNETPSPVVIFIARDHHYTLPYFTTIKENDEIKVSVIGQRFELNDKYISIIAKLIEPKEDRYRLKGGEGDAYTGSSKKPFKIPLKKAKLVITE
jgi:DNA-directed RNA polymerase subunit E'/Rpb7